MKTKISLALGSGAARGCAHLGVIQALEENGFEIEAVAGTSIGALVGGIYCSGGLKDLEELIPKITQLKMIPYWDINWPINGLVKGKKVEKLIDTLLPIKEFQSLSTPFYAVCADINSGNKVVIDKGKILDGIRASISLPGVFPAVEHGEASLIDGGLVDPVPVEVLKQRGHFPIIGVELNDQLENISEGFSPWLQQFNKWVSPNKPLLVDVLYKSVTLLQRELSRKSQQIHPADYLLKLPVGGVRSFDFHKAQMIRDIGYQFTLKQIHIIKKQLLNT